VIFAPEISSPWGVGSESFFPLAVESFQSLPNVLLRDSGV